MDKSKNHNPQGHNQYTHEGKDAPAKQSSRPRDENGEFAKKDGSAHKSTGSKGHANNPEGHNQYSK